MNKDERVIPGYNGYSVTNDGKIKSIARNLELRRYVLNGYLIVDTFRGALTETLPVHRAVALAWVENKDPEKFTIVNHLDGNPLNNFWKNLEWTDYSGNTIHAMENGLRTDNIQCKVRDFYTKEVITFRSIAQALVFLGLDESSTSDRLQPKMFGRLVCGRYEFKFASDESPWFYETRLKLVPPSRYMVVVTNSDGTTEEIYSNMEFLKRYQLYGAPGKSIPALVDYANKLFTDKKFVARDGYKEDRYHREVRKTKQSEIMPLLAIRGIEEVFFPSLTQCARHFEVSRFMIQSRLGNGKDLNGWYFTPLQFS